MIYEQAVLIMKGEKIVKVCKVWTDSDVAKIKIVIKKNGEKKTLERKFKGHKEKPVIIMCCEEVIRCWPKYDPQIHEAVVSSGHTHKVG